MGAAIFERLETRQARGERCVRLGACCTHMCHHARHARAQEDAAASDYQLVLDKVQAVLSAEDFQSLQQFLVRRPVADQWSTAGLTCAPAAARPQQRARSGAPAAHAAAPRRSYLFSFNVITSIGYGNVCPRSAGGQIFFCFYALVSLPIAGVSFGRVAGSITDLISWAHTCRRRSIRGSFAAADTFAHGHITRDAARIAIAAARHCAVDGLEFEEVMKEADPLHSDRITLRLYAWVYAQLGSPDARVLEKRRRMFITFASFAVWNVVGMAVFRHTEGWTWVECAPAPRQQRRAGCMRGRRC